MERALILTAGILLILGTAGPAPLMGGEELIPTASAGSEDDADLGHDASDDPSDPAILAAGGTFLAVLGSSSDEDWYELSAGDAADACAEVEVDSDVDAELTLDVNGNAVTQRIDDGESTRLGVVGADDAALFGVSATSLTDTGTYTFDLALTSGDELRADGDAGSGGDAGDSELTATPLNAGCNGGTLADDDIMDVYTVDGSDADARRVSFAQSSGPDLVLEVEDPDGAQQATLTSGETAIVETPGDGTWTLKVYEAGSGATSDPLVPLPPLQYNDLDADYTLDDGPCRPGC